jgi:hypothetical protein
MKRSTELANGTFLRSIIPVLLKRGIIDMERQDILLATEPSFLDSAVGTTELISLAVSWGICGSASEFWQVHKGRDELLIALHDYQAQTEAAEAAMS